MEEDRAKATFHRSLNDHVQMLDHHHDAEHLTHRFPAGTVAGFKASATKAWYAAHLDQALIVNGGGHRTDDDELFCPRLLRDVTVFSHPRASVRPRWVRIVVWTADRLLHSCTLDGDPTST